MRNYTKIPGYGDVPNLTARYRYLHDLLNRYQHTENYRCTRIEARESHCKDCPFRQTLQAHGVESKCCNWAAEERPDLAIEILEKLLKGEDHMNPAYYEPERPVNPPEPKSYYCPICGAENPEKIVLNIQYCVIGCDECLHIKDAEDYFEEE